MASMNRIFGEHGHVAQPSYMEGDFGPAVLITGLFLIGLIILGTGGFGAFPAIAFTLKAMVFASAAFGVAAGKYTYDQFK
jgi:hypothetical protein